MLIFRRIGIHYYKSYILIYLFKKRTWYSLFSISLLYFVPSR